MTKPLENKGKNSAIRLIRNHPASVSLACLASIAIDQARAPQTPRGGVTTPRPLPLAPTPYIILGGSSE